MNAIERFLSFVFPPRLPGSMDLSERVEYDEQGSCGKAQRKLYANGIERHFAEQRIAKCKQWYSGTHRQYLAQLRNAEAQMAEHERELVAAGYVNVVHDEWMHPDAAM